MQTLYYQTQNFIHHTGNVVDLEEYRRRAALAQARCEAEEPCAARPAQAAPRARRCNPGTLADTALSAAILLLTAVAALGVLL